MIIHVGDELYEDRIKCLKRSIQIFNICSIHQSCIDYFQLVIQTISIFYLPSLQLQSEPWFSASEQYGD